MSVTKEQAADVAQFIRSLAGGTIFGCEFIKRTTGDVRRMSCRLKEPTGDSRDPIHHGLLTVYDMNKNGIRTIPIENIQRLTIRNKVVFDKELL